MFFDVPVLLRLWLQVLNLAAQGPVLGHWTTLQGPVGGLTHCHHVSDQLAQVLLLGDQLHAVNRPALGIVFGVRQSRVEVRRMLRDIRHYNRNKTIFIGCCSVCSINGIYIMWCIYLGQGGAHFIKNRIVRYMYHFMQKLTKLKMYGNMKWLLFIKSTREMKILCTTFVYSISEFLVCCCTCSNYTLCLSFSTLCQVSELGLELECQVSELGLDLELDLECQVSELGMEEGYVCTLLICFYPRITQNLGFLFADKYHFLFPNF